MFDWIVALPAIGKLGLTLVAIVVLMRLRLPKGLAFGSGGCLLGVLFPMSFREFGSAVLAGIISDQTVFLLLIVLILMTFSSALASTRQIERIIESFRAMVGTSRLSLVMFPALIGLLPMPGGAIFSAPMVDAAGKNTGISPERATAANYWFRHVWEFWFPLYPGVILCLTLSGLPTGQFILRQLPMSIASFGLGYLVILRSLDLGAKRHRDYSRATMLEFVRALTPILLVVAAVIALIAPVDWMIKRWEIESIFLQRSPLILGLGLGTAWLFAFRGLTWPTLGRHAKEKRVTSMLWLVVGLMVFRSIMDNCGAVEALRNELTAAGVSLAVAVALLPFIAGLVVGIAFGYVGTSFPFVITMLAVIPQVDHGPYYCYAYTIGYVGMMLSPLHICLILTNQYFKSNLLRVYGYLLPLAVGLAAIGTLLFLCYRYLGW